MLRLFGKGLSRQVASPRVLGPGGLHRFGR